MAWLRHAAPALQNAHVDQDRFIHTICRPDELSGNPFKGELGKWTPCFIDIGLIGGLFSDGGHPCLLLLLLLLNVHSGRLAASYN